MSIQECNDLIYAVAQANRIRRDTLKYGGRSQPIVFARAVAYWMLRNVGKMSYPQIGRMMGGKHHTTIMHGARSIDWEIRQGDGPHIDTLMHTIGFISRKRWP